MIRPGTTRMQYPNGWTNFTPCYSDDMRKLLDKLYAYGNEDVAKVRIEIINSKHSVTQHNTHISMNDK